MRFARRASYCLHFILLAALSSTAMAEKLTIERMFTGPDLSGASLRSPRISPNGRLIAYLRGKDSNKDRLDLWAYDIASHEHRLLVDSAVLERKSTLCRRRKNHGASASAPLLSPESLNTNFRPTRAISWCHSAAIYTSTTSRRSRTTRFVASPATRATKPTRIFASRRLCKLHP